MSARAVTTIELWAEALVNLCKNTNYRSWCGHSPFIRPRGIGGRLSGCRNAKLADGRGKNIFPH